MRDSRKKINKDAIISWIIDGKTVKKSYNERLKEVRSQAYQKTRDGDIIRACGYSRGMVLLRLVTELKQKMPSSSYSKEELTMEKTKMASKLSVNNRNSIGRFVEGSSGNPNGRPLGSKNKFTTLKNAFIETFEELG